MTDELKLCPFCKLTIDPPENLSDTVCQHFSRASYGTIYVTGHFYGLIADIKNFNNRPIEDELKAEIKALKKTIKLKHKKDNFYVRRNVALTKKLRKARSWLTEISETECLQAKALAFVGLRDTR